MSEELIQVYEYEESVMTKYIVVKCAWCDKLITVQAEYHHPAEHYYCSPDCRLEGDYHYDRRTVGPVWEGDDERSDI